MALLLSNELFNFFETLLAGALWQSMKVV